MARPVTVIAWLIFVWLTVTFDQVTTKPSLSAGSVSLRTSVGSGRIPNVTLSAQVAVINNLQCQKELVCQVDARTSILRRILEIAIFETRTQSVLRKVSSIYYLKAENATLHRPGIVDSIQGIVRKNGALVVHKVLPPNTGFASEEFACKVLYVDNMALGVKSVESDSLEEKEDGICKVPDVLQKLDTIEQKLGNLSVLQLKQNKVTDIELQEGDCKVPYLLNKLDVLDGKMSKLSEAENHEKFCKVTDLGPKLDALDRKVANLPDLEAKIDALDTKVENLSNVEDKLNKLLDVEELGKVWNVPEMIKRLKDLENKVNNITDGDGKLRFSDDDAKDVADKLRTLSVVQSNQTELLSNLFAVITSKLGAVNATPPVVRRGFFSCDSFRDLDSGDDVPARQMITWPSGLKVLCDISTTGGGWTVFQRRYNGLVNFYRGWDEYEKGFGDLNQEFWLGLKHVQRLVEGGEYELRIDMKLSNGSEVYARYSHFNLSPPCSKYKLSVSRFSGNVKADSLNYHNGMAFTTMDSDNDKHSTINCAKENTGAWWYNGCAHSSLNMLWRRSNPEGIYWSGAASGHNYVTYSEMKVRRRK